MIKSYLGLAIVFAVHHQVLTADVDQRKFTHKIRKDKKYMIEELKDIHKRSETTQDYIDNYDLIVTVPTESLMKPVLRHGHVHHRHRSGTGAKVPIKNYNQRILQGANIIRKSNNITVETNMTQIQEDKSAKTINYLNEYRKVVEEITTARTQEQNNATTANYLNEHRKELGGEATTQIGEDKNVTTANYLNEHRKELGGEATTQIGEDKNVTTANYLNEHRKELGGEATTQIGEDKNVTTANYLNEHRRGGEYEAAKSQNPVKKNQKVSHMVPFYRRVNYVDDHERNKPQKWVHCLDLVGPRLKGYADNWPPKELKNRHNDIRRLAELLITDVSKYTEEEIVSVLSQISKIDLRLFQWDYSAITMIMNVIITGPAHNFKTLKSGVKYMFERWHLDTSMIRTFLEQTRIFRPPCIDISGSSGFTKKAGGILLFTKPDKPTKKPRNPDKSCRSREISTVNHNND